VSLAPVIVKVADAIGKALPAAIGIVTPVMAPLITLVGNPAFSKLAIAALAIAAGMKAWSAAQAIVTTATKVATGVQRAFQAVYNVGQLTKYVATLVASRAATLAASAASKVAAAAQVVLNAALDANPIGLVVIAIAALVAGFVIAYKNSATFRTIVQGALKAVAEVRSQLSSPRLRQCSTS
jgi:phage-related protein